MILLKLLRYRLILRNNSLILRLSVRLESCVEVFVREGEDLCGEQSGIDSSVDRNSSYRDTTGHLYCGKKGFNAA